MLDEDYAEASKNLEAMGSAMMLQVRTRFIEECLAHAMQNGATQLVILGAGFDTRAYRLTGLLSVARVFEVDRPSTQQYKMRRIREAGIEVPQNLSYVPVDFRSDKLPSVLHASGYDSRQLTFFIWEGVTMYLPEAAIEETLSWIGAQAAGSAVVFDFVYRGLLEFVNTVSVDQLPEPAKQGIGRLRKLEAGEPWVFGFPTTETEYLTKFGLTTRELMIIGGEESRKRYLIRSDGSAYLSLPSDMQQPPAAPPGFSYSLAEALV